MAVKKSESSKKQKNTPTAMTTPTATGSRTRTKLYRSNTNKVIAGVAGGLGEYFNIDPTIIRLLFILLTVFGGSGVLIYIIFWIIMPAESDIKKSPKEAIQSSAHDIRNSAQQFASDLKNGSRENSRFWWGVLAIVFGFLFLFNNLGVWNLINIGEFWPVILIFFGLLILLKKN